jgi:DNA-binding SARP family transcriptional activator
LLLDRLQQLVRNGPVSPLTETAALWLEGVCWWLYGDLDQATTALRRGVAVGDRTGVKLMHPVILLHLAQVELASGNRIGARDCFSRAKELLPAARPYDRFACLLLMGRVHLVEGSIQEALAEAEEAVVLSRATGGGAAEPYALLLLAEALRAAGSRREAFRQVTDALRSAIRGGSAHYVFSSLLLVAQLHLESGSRSRALAVLRRGLKLGRESEFRRAYGFYGSPALALLCALALEVDVEGDYVRSLIRHNDLAPTPAIKVGEEWPWPVRIQTLGRFQIWLHGEPMKVGRKAPRKPLELLKALIALGGHGVPEWSLADALWPDAGGDAAHAALETALYRLRKLLGVRQALVLHEGRLTLDPQYCWVDADALEQLLREAEGAGDGSSCTTPTPRALRERALSLYQGPFLFGVDEAWAILRRNRLRNSCLRAAAAVGTEHEAAGACQQAVEWYRKGLESDPLGEEFYQGLIRCYLRLGRRADALAAYRRCRQVLAKVLRVEPNEATAALVGERVGNAVSPSSAHPDT